MGKTPKVTIILPSLNVAGYIRQCMDSVVNQTLSDIEIVCIDAGSTDGTVDILKTYEEHDARIKIIRSGRKSYGYQVNIGLQCAHGEYIAILETDDYVDKCMYENLYTIGKKYKLDFLLADFDRFYDDAVGMRKFETVRTWTEYPEIYGKLLSQEDLKRFYNANSNLWRGIYSRVFLLRNKILLNETHGAAYQDICFMHRIVMSAERAMFVPDSYYRYRTDREGSSINSVRGLQYSYQEYKYLLENDEIIQGFEPRIYGMMAKSFFGEITQIFPRMGSTWKEDNRIYYDWFKQQLLYGIEMGYISEETIGAYIWKYLQILLNSLEDYLLKLEYPGNSHFLIQRLKGKQVVIFGAGVRGRIIYSKMKNKACINAFCDNNQELWDSKLEGIPVLSAQVCMEVYPDANYIITVKNHFEEIRQQICSYGVSSEQIWGYMADHD